MGDTSVTKVDSAHSPRGPEGERYLASGVRASMRLWDEPAGAVSRDHTRDYEVVGYVLSGRAELHLEGQIVVLAAGDSYVVPRGARHHYRVLERFFAVESTSPPAQVHGRDTSEPSENRGDAPTSEPSADGYSTEALGRHLRALRRHRARATATYHRLLEDVKNAGGLSTKRAAETALLVVVAGICRRIPHAEADHLLSQLSSITREQLAPFPEKPDREITVDMIESELRSELHLNHERAASLLGAICNVIAEHVSPGQVACTRRSLPAGFRELFPAQA